MNNQRLTILGAGESGVGAALLGKQTRWKVFVSDFGAIKSEYKTELVTNEIPFEEEQHSEDKILRSDLVIKSPGIPDKAPIIQKIIEKGIPIISEIEFGYRYATGKTIAITGSNGKTTTTSMIAKVLKDATLDVAVGGNIGKSFARLITEKQYEWFVLELSSFQLDGIDKFKPFISILLNLSPDHLDRYNYEYQNYINSKFRITKNQTHEDYFVYWEDDKEIIKQIPTQEIKAKQVTFSLEKELAEGAFYKDETLQFRNNKTNYNMSIYKLAVQGKHNFANAMASGIVANILQLRKETVRESLSNFKSLEHRLESVSTVHGVHFINDSKATNVNSTWFALESAKAPIIWIAGGVDKGNDYTSLIPLVKKKVKAIVCMGLDNRKIHEAFGNHVDLIANTGSAKEAVQVAHYFASKGDNVLLSPACASFDLFSNYEDRGRQFKQAVKQL